jgi:hypothetical protein
VLHLARRVGVGGDVGDLLQLQRALEAHREPHVAAEVEEELAVLDLLGDAVDRLRRALGDRRDGGRQPLELGHQRAARRLVERPAQLGDPQREQVHDRHLRDERLGGGDADLEPRAGVEHAVGVARGL